MCDAQRPRGGGVRAHLGSAIGLTARGGAYLGQRDPTTGPEVGTHPGHRHPRLGPRGRSPRAAPPDDRPRGGDAPRASPPPASPEGPLTPGCAVLLVVLCQEALRAPEGAAPRAHLGSCPAEACPRGLHLGP